MELINQKKEKMLDFQIK